MRIFNQRLTVQRTGNAAFVSLQYTVTLVEPELNLLGGFIEEVRLEPAPMAGSAIVSSPLPIGVAATGIFSVGSRSFDRQFQFELPRYPQGPFTTVRFHGSIRIYPAHAYADAQRTNEVALPARYPLTDRLYNVMRRLTDFLRR